MKTYFYPKTWRNLPFVFLLKSNLNDYQGKNRNKSAITRRDARDKERRRRIWFGKSFLHFSFPRLKKASLLNPTHGKQRRGIVKVIYGWFYLFNVFSLRLLNGSSWIFTFLFLRKLSVVPNEENEVNFSNVADGKKSCEGFLLRKSINANAKNFWFESFLCETSKFYA